MVEGTPRTVLVFLRADGFVSVSHSIAGAPCMFAAYALLVVVLCPRGVPMEPQPSLVKQTILTGVHSWCGFRGTQADGTFTFNDLPSASYTMEVCATLFVC